MGIKSTQIETHDAITAVSCDAAPDASQGIREEYFDLARIFARVVVENHIDEVIKQSKEVGE